MVASHAPIADLVSLPCPYGNDPSTPTAYSRLSIQEPMARPDSAREDLQSQNAFHLLLTGWWSVLTGWWSLGVGRRGRGVGGAW